MKLACALSLTVFVLASTSASAQVAEFSELPMNALYCPEEDGNAGCAKMVNRLEADNRKAWQGDYQAQRNVAYCLSDGCGAMVVPNRALGCAWRIIIIGSGSPKVDSTDIGNLKVYCGGLDAAERSAAKAQAGAIFRAVYKREIGPVAW